MKSFCFYKKCTIKSENFVSIKMKRQDSSNVKSFQLWKTRLKMTQNSLSYCILFLIEIEFSIKKPCFVMGKIWVDNHDKQNWPV